MQPKHRAKEQRGERMKKMVFNISTEAYEDYKLLSKKTKRTMASLIREAIDQYLSNDSSDATPENVPYAGE